jgi:proteasome activator-like protein
MAEQRPAHYAADVTDREEPTQTERPDHEGASVGYASKLLRIGMMAQEMLGEARRAPLDEKARHRLREAIGRSIDELRTILPRELQRELDDVTFPLTDEPSESELRLAEAQLIGWLQGLFHGIQASLFAQQMQAQAQAQNYPRRSLPDNDGDAGRYL